MKSGKTTALIVGGAIGTTIVNGVLDGVNTTGNAVLGTLVTVSKYILLAAIVMFVVNKIE